MRLALAAKGSLLAAMGALFGALALRALGPPARWWAILFGLGFVLLGAFLAWAGLMAWLDALIGGAVTASGARALPSRRAGHSLRLPDGHFVEFILHNPWAPLVPGRIYNVTYGRFSRVLVAPPVEGREG